jgi:hypothetical protein
MVIWTIIPDSNKYRKLETFNTPTDDWELCEGFESGGSMVDSWIPIPVRLFEYKGEETKPLGDFPSVFAGVPPVFSKRSLKVLDPLIGDSIEALPLVGVGDDFSVINVKVIDCLDHQRSRYVRFENSERIMYIEHYAFKESRLENKHIFRIPEVILSAVFVSDAFKALVEENDLQGLIFERAA